MKIFSKLNTWIKALLLSKYIGGQVRHGLTFVAGFLIAKGLASAEQAAEVVNTLSNLLTSPDFIGGVIALLGGSGASILEKKNR